MKKICSPSSESMFQVLMFIFKANIYPISTRIMFRNTVLSDKDLTAVTSSVKNMVSYAIVSARTNQHDKNSPLQFYAELHCEGKRC